MTVLPLFTAPGSLTGALAHRVRRYVLGALVLFAAAGSAYADVPGSQDLPILERFAGSDVVSFIPAQPHERVYPLAPVSRISGRLRFEREVLASGERVALTYQIPAPHSADEAFTQAREQLQAQGAHLLYWCEGRECGASSLWANSVFGNATLYGSDNQQAYALLRLTEPQDALVALYSITRGNRRAYLHVEQLTAQQPLGQLLPTPVTLFRQLRSDGSLTLPAIADADSAWVALLARGLSLDSTVRVSLSGAQAPLWREKLIGLNIREARLAVGSEEGERLSIELLR